MTFHKYLKIKIIGSDENKELLSDPDDEIVIEEKIDGANFRFMIVHDDANRYRIIFGSRNQSLGDDTSKIGGNWEKCVKYLTEKITAYMKGRPLKEVENNLYFGENCVRHSMGYNWDEIPPFLGFDIYELERQEFIDYPANMGIFNDMGLVFVPVLDVVKAKDIKEFADTDVPITKYPPTLHPDTQAEGVVFKNYNKQIFAKYKTEKFNEKARGTFGGIKKFSRDDTELITNTYCTNARIEGNILKLVDIGETLGMPLMAKLPNKVYDDIFEEHWREIVHSRFYINFKDLKRQVTRRCLMVLKQVITNRGLQT